MSTEPNAATPKMTKTERESLEKLIRQKAGVAKHDAEARGKVLLAHAEAQLSARFRRDDELFAHVTKRAEEMAAAADQEIAEICRRQGVREEFRPRISLDWLGRSENASAERRAELRRLAQANVAALVSAAKVEIDREATEQTSQLLLDGLASPEARAFLGRMPSPEELLPPLTALNHRGEVFELASPTAGDCNQTVTVDRNGVTESVTDPKACAHCRKPLEAGRGRYCSSACRQAAYRRRQGKK